MVDKDKKELMSVVDVDCGIGSSLFRLAVGSSGGAELMEQSSSRGAESRRSAALARLPEHQILWPAHRGAAPAPLLL